jgi:hypothetical protein
MSESGRTDLGGGVYSLVDLYESDLDKIQRVIVKINEHVGHDADFDALQREIKGRFEEAGYVVDVAWYEFAVDGHKVEGGAMPEITIQGRTDRFEWDPDRQVHEIVNDTLGLGEGGWIKSGSGLHVPAHGHSHGGDGHHTHG